VADNRRSDGGQPKPVLRLATYHPRGVVAILEEQLIAT
jgi:hypothetical protein